MAFLDILAFFGLVFLISLSGVLLPGPMTAATIAKSYSDKWAGAKFAIGHGAVEMPLLVVIAAGSAAIVTEQSLAIQSIGLLGGGYLIMLGVTIIRDRGFMSDEEAKDTLMKNSVMLGITTTLLNPSFHIWWVTIGILLVTQAIELGIVVLVLFAVVHWFCDLAWGIAISFGIQKAKQFYASRLKDVLRYISAIMILIFGLFFAITSGYSILS